MLPRHLRSLPYLVHTNRELGLMLRGVKPVASFVVEDGPECLLRYLRMFDRHVQVGRFSKREILVEREGRKLRRVLYAIPGEEWRIDALLTHYASDPGWSVQDERREGQLLGYADWQVTAWLDHLGRNGLSKVC